ncbi:MAG TPA: hypothetical protein PKA55_15640 [Rhodoblastus sp.]|nr:hypothetical protein [Rhodoblastus sp.]
MGSYRIWVRRDGALSEFSVGVHDESCRAVAHADALSTLHAKKVARDLITLVQRRDPQGIFTVRRNLRSSV